MVRVCAERAADEIRVVRRDETGQIDRKDDQQLNEAERDQKPRDRQRLPRRPESIHRGVDADRCEKAVDEDEDGTDRDARRVKRHRHNTQEEEEEGA